MIKRIFCALIAAMLVFMCACTKNTQSAVIEYKSGGKTVGSIDTGFMYFWISFQKNMYEPVANSYEEGWNHITNEEMGEDLYDLLLTEASESAKKLLAIEYIHDKEYKLKLSDEQKDALEKQIESYITSYGSKAALESELSKYGASVETLKRYFELMLKQNALFEYMCRQNAAIVTSEEELKEYFKRNYVIADHIFFSIAGGTKEDGTVVSLPEEEIEAKKNLSRDVYTRIVSLGEDFDELKEQYNEDVFATQYYPHGFFVTNDGTFPAEFVNAVFSDTEAEIVYAETPKTGFHVIRRLPMDESLYNAYSDVYTKLSSAVKSAAFANTISEKAGNAYLNEELFSNYNPEVIPSFRLG